MYRRVEWAYNLPIQSDLKRSSCNKIIWVTHTFLEHNFMKNNLILTEYKVLARKYRPQKFDDLIGQDSLVLTLTNAITTNRTAHAYLLTGVRGIGKTTTARLIAMSLNCELKTNDSCEPCGNCDSCISIRDDRNLDVIEMDAASKTGVDDIREIIDNVKYKPVNCKYKIFIIDEVHMLSKNAFNALLKTLEEPPPHIKFIFATTEVKKIPITIISRCQRFDLRRIESQKLTSHLLSIAEKENIKIEKDAIALIVRAADGSVRDGLSLLDQAIVNKNETVSTKIIIKMLGLADRGQVFDLLDAIFKGEANASLNIFNNIYQAGADVLMIFDEMLKITHFLTQIKIFPEIKNDIYIPELERTKGAEMAEKISMSSLGTIWQVLFKGYQELQYGSHLFQHGEMLIIRLIYLYEGPSPDDLVKKIKKEVSENQPLQSSTQNNIKTEISNPSTKLEVYKENQNNNKTTEPTSILPVKSFRQFVDLFYQRREGMLHTYLYNNTKLISFKEGKVIINAEKIADSNFPRTIARLISKWTGRIWQVSSSSSNIGQTLYEEDVINQQKEIELMKNDSEVKLILDKYPEVIIHSITDIGATTDEQIDKKEHQQIKE